MYSRYNPVRQGSPLTNSKVKVDRNSNEGKLWVDKLVAHLFAFDFFTILLQVVCVFSPITITIWISWEEIIVYFARRWYVTLQQNWIIYRDTIQQIMPQTKDYVYLTAWSTYCNKYVQPVKSVGSSFTAFQYFSNNGNDLWICTKSD